MEKFGTLISLAAGHKAVIRAVLTIFLLRLKGRRRMTSIETNEAEIRTSSDACTFH